MAGGMVASRVERHLGACFGVLALAFSSACLQGPSHIIDLGSTDTSRPPNPDLLAPPDLATPDLAPSIPITCTDNAGVCVLSCSPTTDVTPYVFVDGDDTTSAHIDGPHFPITIEIKLPSTITVTNVRITHATSTTIDCTKQPEAYNRIYRGKIQAFVGGGWADMATITNGSGNQSRTAQTVIVVGGFSAVTDRIRIIDLENDCNSCGWWPAEFAWNVSS